MATVSMQLSEFSELCRLCGAKTSVLLGLHIFENEGNLRQIYKKITACLPIQVTNNDKLPKMVCEECVYKLDALFDFREKSMKTEYALNNMLKNLYNSTVSNDLGIQMDSLLCTSSIAAESLHIRQPVEVNVHLENNSEHLDAIIGLPVNNSNHVKCESEMVSIKADSGTPVAASVNSNSTGNAAGGCVKGETPMESECCDSDTDSLTHDQSECCTMQNFDSVDHRDPIASEIQVTNIGTLQELGEGSIKSNDTTEEVIHSSPNYIVTSQPDQTWFFCNICGKPFDDSTEFHEHCEIHWKKCGICGVSCANEDSLLDHMREEHPRQTNSTLSSIEADELEENESIKKSPNHENSTKKPSNGKRDGKRCDHCGKEYKTNYKLAEHMRKHTGEKPFKCSVCDKTFRSKIGLAQHEAKHTGHYDYTCNTCGKGFQCKSYLIVHQRVHSDLKPYPCETCGRNFKTKQSLLDHQNRHLGVKPYLCETCGRGFITKGLCKSHQRVHSGADNRQFPCSVCNKLFVSKSYLVTHMRIHTGEKPFMCEVCGKGFLTRVDLKIHSTMHTGEKSFVCEVCGKAFARRDALRCHKRSHTGERPYKCDICGQGFTQFSPMAIHKRLHTGERPYSCDICGKTFVSKSTMMSHRKKHIP
ncbi:hypothetical protein O3M35_013222 [Rhynocoris fuscipes]|uniref:Uncharacterized protein n=1 Tax=Rhynocoris fuscipes TaxID=488301 RepID=A0AAW1CIC1_9HEMI